MTPAFLPSFTAYFIYQGVVQFAQARYQHARHYARRAMGRAEAMDVSQATETLHESLHSGLWGVVLLNAIAQAWQVVNGAQLLYVLVRQLDPLQPWYNFREELQCAALGALFILVGVANATTMLQTLLGKAELGRRRAARSRLAAGGAAGGGGGDTAAAPPAAADARKND